MPLRDRSGLRANPTSDLHTARSPPSTHGSRPAQLHSRPPRTQDERRSAPAPGAYWPGGGVSIAHRMQPSGSA
eukprot:3085492-Prymnesium_polylepis.1